MRTILVFHIFSSHTFGHAILSFMESWTKPIVVVVVDVVVVQVLVVAIHIPRVVRVVLIRRTKQKLKLVVSPSGLCEYYPILIVQCTLIPISIIIQTHFRGLDYYIILVHLSKIMWQVQFLPETCT